MLRSLAVGLALLALDAPGGAATVYVGNDGLDGATCGAKTAPCRSITQGIARAVAGDTVLVGAGRYGDLDADGTFGEPGEERDSLALVHVDKPVRVISRDGAAATFIEGTQELEIPNTAADSVRLDATGAALGARDHGFTIVSYYNSHAVFSMTSGVKIEGNVVIEGHTGYFVSGGGSEILDSRAFATGVGFEASVGANRMERCAAVGTDRGFVMFSPNVLQRSVAVGNRIGVSSTSIATLVSAIGNEHGVQMNDAAASLDRSNVFGNELCGLDSQFEQKRVFFGAATGPAEEPPADPICSGGTATAAKREFRVRPRGIR